MLTTFKKVGIPTQLIRDSKAVNGVKTIVTQFQGVQVELKNSIEKPYYFGAIVIDTPIACNVYFKRSTIARNANATLELDLMNASVAKRIASGTITQFECEGYIVDISTGVENATCLPKVNAFEFFSNENDFTLE